MGAGADVAEFSSDSGGRRTRANKQPEYDKSHNDTANARAGNRGEKALVGGGRGHVGAAYSSLVARCSQVRFEV